MVHENELNEAGLIEVAILVSTTKYLNTDFQRLQIERKIEGVNIFDHVIL